MTSPAEINTDERMRRVRERVEQMRRRLATVATEGDFPQMDEIARVVNDLAAAVGALRATYLVVSGGDDRDLVRALLQPPSDTFSGRGNDVRRSEADGYRAAVSDLIRHR